MSISINSARIYTARTSFYCPFICFRNQQVVFFVLLFYCQGTVRILSNLNYSSKSFFGYFFFAIYYFNLGFYFVCTLVITSLHHSAFTTSANRWFPHRTFLSYRFNNYCQLYFLHFVTCLFMLN